MPSHFLYYICPSNYCISINTPQTYRWVRNIPHFQKSWHNESVCICVSIFRLNTMYIKYGWHWHGAAQQTNQPPTRQREMSHSQYVIICNYRSRWIMSTLIWGCINGNDVSYYVIFWLKFCYFHIWINRFHLILELKSAKKKEIFFRKDIWNLIKQTITLFSYCYKNQWRKNKFIVSKVSFYTAINLNPNPFSQK